MSSAGIAAYGPKAVFDGLPEERERAVHISETCAYAMQKHINTIKEIDPRVTFSFEHPKGRVRKKAWFKDLVKQLGGPKAHSAVATSVHASCREGDTRRRYQCAS